MAGTLSSRSPPLDWRFSQVFGDRPPGEDADGDLQLQDVDLISAIQFDSTGDHLAVGDRGGRVVIFKTNHSPQPHFHQHSLRTQLEQLDSPVSLTSHPEYQYMTEFQSHEPEFDYLKSLEIEEKINNLRWCAASNRALFLLSANDKTIKLWKVVNHIPGQRIRGGDLHVA